MKRLLLAAIAVCFVFFAKAQNYSLNKGYSFIENKGQVVDQNGKPALDILFTSKIGNAKLFLAKGGVHYVWEKMQNRPTADAKKDPQSFADQLEQCTVESYRLDVALIGANPQPIIQTFEPSDDFINYYITNRKEGIVGVRHFARVVYKDIYPGIDWVWYNNEGSIKYDFIVNPGADYKQIKIKVSGADKIKLLEDGGLGIETPLGRINENKPVSFINGHKTISHFNLSEDIISFNVPEATKADRLVIDPLVLIWSTYYGGEGLDIMYSVATGKTTSNVYVTGFTNSTTGIYFGGHQDHSVATSNMVVAKFDENGNRKWATYYGGDATNNIASGISTDSLENVYVVGTSNAIDSVSYNGYQNTYGGGSSDAVLVKFDNNGVRKWATYYGNTGLDGGFCLAIDSKGWIWIAGKTSSSSGFSSSGATTYKGNSDGFLAYFDSSGNRILGEYFGGTNFDEIVSITLDNNDNVYFVGDTKSTSGISKSAHQGSFGGGTDAFIAKYSTSLIWATYYGAGGNDFARSISVDNSNNIYVSGETGSPANIATTGAYQTTLKGGADAFLVKFDANGSRKWGTYFGGEVSDRAAQNVVDNLGEIVVVGSTSSLTGISSNVYQHTYGGGVNDGLIAKFNASGSLLWGTYFGDSLNDGVGGVTYNKDGAMFITGYTYSLKNIAQGGHQNTNNGEMDGFLTKFIDLNVKPNAFTDYTTCGKLDIDYIAKKPSNLYVTRWYDSDTGANWFYEGDTLSKTFTQTDTIWAAFVSGPNSGPRVRAIVKILPTPDASFTVNDSIQCTYTNSFIFGNTTNTNGTNATYQWDFDDGAVSSKFNDTHKYLNIGVYKVKLDATNTANGCKTRYEKTIIVLKLPVQQITGPIVSQQWETKNYSAKPSAGSTYTWTITGGTQISGGTTENISVTWGTGLTGKVEVVENDTNGCHSDAVIVQVSLSPNFVDEVRGNFVSIYPNPASKTMFVEATREGTYTITDITGRQLLSAPIQNTAIQAIDISKLLPGTYLFNYITNSGATHIAKVAVY